MRIKYAGRADNSSYSILSSSAGLEESAETSEEVANEIIEGET